jgi:acyl transferase domain-containing protein/NADPH:quinone reductase-like Zn-dependent oxidoreductase
MNGAGVSPLKRALRAIDDLQTRLAATENLRNEPIAIIGLGCRVPGGGDDPESFWELLRSGRDAVTEVPPDRWDVAQHYDPDPETPGKTYTKWGGFLRSVDGFDPQFFGISPREAVDMDPQQRLLLEVAWEALENAGQAPDLLVETNTGVFVGVCSSDYTHFSSWSGEAAHVTPYSASGIAHSVVSGRLAYMLGLHGPAISVNTACSSSLVAFHLACQSLRMHECRMALTGGVSTSLTPDNTIAFCRTKMMSPTGRCRTFSADADGFVLGEGCGVVVLKRLSDALADGDRIWAVVRASAANQDGASGGLTVPSGPAQEEVIRRAVAEAGLSPNDITFVETHGTGTSLGDPIEVRALAGALCRDRSWSSPLYIGSVKTNVGHMEAAAAVTSVIKAVLSLQHGEIPPHLHAENLSPLVPWAEWPIEVPRTLLPWPKERRRIAGVSAFGFSGTNVHVVLEEAPATGSRILGAAERPLHVMTISARTPTALRALAAKYADRLETGTDSLADFAHTANRGRAQGFFRRAMVASTPEKFEQGLRVIASGRDEEAIFKGDLVGTDAPRIVFLFTGQGAQTSGMGWALYEASPTFRRALDQCASILKKHIDRPLIDLLFDAASASLLGQTAYTQPALFSLEYALAALWRSWGVRPAAVLGHSLGEFVAACVAGVLGLEDGLDLVAARGRLMQALPEAGTMAVISAGEDRVAEAVARYSQRVSIAGLNAPGSVVISGGAAEVETLCEELAALGVQSKKLFVSHGFHSPLMNPMLAEFERVAKQGTYSAPAIPLVSNVTGEAFGAGQVPDADYWVRHVRQPVRYAASIEGLYRKGYRLFLEIGPRPTLSGLGRQTITDESVTWLPSLRDGQEEWRTMLESLASLYTRGVRIDWRGFDRDYDRRLISLPTYPFERKRHWVERRPAMPTSQAGAHPLVGRRLQSPALHDVVFQTRLSAAGPAFIGEHRIFDTTVLPGMAYLEMALAAGEAAGLGNKSLVVRDLLIHEAMIFEQDEVRDVQVVIGQAAGTESALRIFSQKAGRDGITASWRLHASARLSSAVPADTDLGLDEARRRCGPQEPAAGFYSDLARLGISLGPRFQGNAGLCRGMHEALARVDVPAITAKEAKHYRFHPAWLDACLQALVGAVAIHENHDHPAIFMPIGVASFEVREGPAGTLWSHAVLSDGADANGDAFTGNVTVYTDDGRVVAKLSGIVLKRADAKALAKLAGRLPAEIEGWLYEPVWELAPIPVSATPAPVGAISPPESRRWLLFADRQGLGDRLAKRLREAGGEAVVVRPGDSFQVNGSAEFTVNPQDPSNFREMIAAATQGHTQSWKGVVHLAALDCVSSSRATSESLRSDISLACGSALHLMQGLSGDATPPRVWLVTRGACSVDRYGIQVESAQATLWGLGRSAVLEHPEWRTTNVDLSPEVDLDDVTALVSELTHEGEEDRIARRPDGRFVERLVRRRDAEQREQPIAVQGRAYDLDITSRGILDNLHWREVGRRSPGPNEVEIEVEATGLNFRDVLNSLGLYPGAPPFGAECAGRIVAIGEGVHDLHIGQRVVAAAPESFRRFVTVASRFVRACPARLTAMEAATIPIAFVTACFGLEHVAKLSRGERVLIHAAAGGVGLAAIQVARSAGAEIFATAGSDSKRDYLRSLGIQHIMDSRSTAFAQQIMQATAGRGVDVVLNSLIGDAIPKSFEVLAPGGRFVELGKRDVWTKERVAALRKDIRYEVIDWGVTAQEDPEVIDRIFTRVMDGVRRQEFEPLPYRVFSTSAVVDAFRHMAAGHHRGKIVIRHPAGKTHATDDVRVHANATYLVTGAFGGLGLLTAKWLVQQGAQHIVLIGRRDPDEAAKKAIRELQELGARVKPLVVDVADRDRMERLLPELVSGDPPLCGIIHAAGTLDDGVILQQSWPRFARVLAPKVDGTFILHRGSLDAPLDFFVVFSSIASLFGSPGQSNYAAANAYLDALAQERRALGLPAVSINWGAWSEVGMGARTGAGKRLSEMGIAEIAPDQGLDLMGRLLNPARPQMAVIPADWQRFLAHGPVGRQPLFKRLESAKAVASTQTSAAAAVTWKEELANVPPGNRNALLEARITVQAVKVLGLGSDGTVDARRPLQEMGLDSLMAIELRNALAQGAGEALPSTLLFDHPTIDALVAFIQPMLCKQEVAASTDDAQPEPMVAGDVLNQIESLSDEEVDRMLAGHKAK